MTVSFQQYFDNKYMEMNRKIGSAITFYRDENGKLQYKIDISKLPQGYNNPDKVARIDRASVSTTFICHQLFKSGVKLFKFNNLDFEALENMDIPLEMKDYNQPFPALFIELPPNYTQNRLVRFCSHNELSEPRFIGLCHDAALEFMLAICFYETGMVHVSSFSRNETLEEQIKPRDAGGFNWEFKQPTTEEEKINFSKILTAAFNAALLMDEVGVRKIGPANPKYYEKLIRKNKQQEATIHPIIYTFAQNVKIYDQESIDREPGESDGSTRKTHWRRGFWRMQRCGPALSLRKRIRIRPVIVNKKYFEGDLTNVQSKYDVSL
jgi:hypothetical protein